ncbi:MAG: folylpolyglutamate synthase/dihydrofolate synthase family protein [Pseudomonadota bacterium]
MNHNAPEVTEALQAFEGLYPETIELSLGRIEAVLDSLGRPQDHLPPVIHVAGTNGKGSTCAYLRAMVEAAGLSTHVFTSPHLVRFNERIRLAGKLVQDQVLVDFLNRTRLAVGNKSITHFEATTAAAILAFSETPADLLILEVGLGGRFDATNVISAPAVSVITPVDFDHKKFLGDDLPSIAGEKAGIIKAGRPCVSAPQAKAAERVIVEKARAVRAPLRFMKIEDVEAVPELVALPGNHQRQNAALAGLALRQLDAPTIQPPAIWKGAQSAVWPARLQQLGPGPLTHRAGSASVWLDGGHNPHAASAVADVLRTMGGGTVLVTAMMASKDHSAFFRTFEGLIDGVHTVPNSEGHAGALPEDLARSARASLPNITAHDSFEAGFAAAVDTGVPRILICGSLYLAGDVLALNEEWPN